MKEILTKNISEDINKMGVDSSISTENLEIARQTPVFRGKLASYEQDRENDIFQKGAFDDSVARKNYTKLCYNHNVNQVIGRLDLSLEDDGLYVTGYMNLGYPLADEVYSLLKMSALDELSISCRAEDSEPIDPIRPYAGMLVKKADIYEGSIVTVPSNTDATINDVKKSISEKKVELKKSFDEKKNNKQKALDSIINFKIDDIK